MRHRLSEWEQREIDKGGRCGDGRDIWPQLDVPTHGKLAHDGENSPSCATAE